MDNRQGDTEDREVARAQLIYRQKLQHAPQHPQGVALDSLEDYAQQELNDILDRFRQRSGEALLTWMVRCLKLERRECS